MNWFAKEPGLYIDKNFRTKMETLGSSSLWNPAQSIEVKNNAMIVR